MAKKGGETTSKSVASKASAILSNPTKSSAAAKSVAASALTQAASKGARKGK